MYTVVTRMRWLKRAAFPFTKATNSFWKKLAILLYSSSPVLRACAAHFQALWPLLLLTGARIQEILLAVGAASSSPPRHIYLCKYITSTSTSSEVWTYTECLVWFGLAIDQWELRWLSIIFRPMRRELTMVSSKPLKLTMVSLKPLNLSMVLSNQYSLKRMKLSCGSLDSVTTEISL